MPDLILMDIQMPGWTGLETTRRIKARMPYVKIVILTVSGKDENLFEAIKSGAQGYLLKGIEPAELVGLLRGLYRGEAPISRLSATRILEEFARLAETPKSTPSPENVLTPREKEVLGLVVKGATNKQIATELSIAENTVKNHLSNILAKLHLHSRTQAAAYAVQQDLLENSRDGD
jgi:DNA-binding NarL/FixJ family response regulator